MGKESATQRTAGRQSMEDTVAGFTSGIVGPYRPVDRAMRSVPCDRPRGKRRLDIQTPGAAK
ncbi:MAG: hypothetical protein O3B84_04540, partial [Chloroflexi bacterium]|nr:hypothetical protein [Chloroflexota bacterium]